MLEVPVEQVVIGELQAGGVFGLIVVLEFVVTLVFVYGAGVLELENGG